MVFLFCIIVLYCCRWVFRLVLVLVFSCVFGFLFCRFWVVILFFELVLVFGVGFLLFFLDDLGVLLNSLVFKFFKLRLLIFFGLEYFGVLKL